MATGYFDAEYMRTMGSVPAAVLDDWSAENPGRLEALIFAISRLMDSYLFKRYATPFDAPVPEVIKFRGTQILSHQLRVIIGFDPGSRQDEQIILAKDDAFMWLTNAAKPGGDAIVGLPLREPADGKKDVTGVARRKARAFSYERAIDWHRERRGR